MDSQPFYFIFACVYLFLSLDKRVPKILYLVFLVPLISFFVGLLTIEGVNFLFVRGLLGYLFFATAIFSFYTYTKEFGFPSRILTAVNVVYLSVAVVQVIVGPDIFSSIAPVRTSDERGVTSLAVEPTFFGIVLIFLSWLHLLSANYKPTRFVLFLVILNIFSILLLAKSSMAFLMILVALGFFLVFKLNLKRLLTLGAIALLIPLVISQYLEGSRLYSLSEKILTDGVYTIVKVDASINDRVGNVVVPIVASMQNYLVPMGYDSYSIEAERALELFDGYFWAGSYEKILSFFGTFVFELGVFGLIIFAVIWILASNGNKQRHLEVMFLYTILNSAIPIAFPLVGFVIATFFLDSQRICPITSEIKVTIMRNRKHLKVESF